MSNNSTPATYGIVGKMRLCDGTLGPVLRIIDLADPERVAGSQRHFGSDYRVFAEHLTRRAADALCDELAFTENIIRRLRGVTE